MSREIHVQVLREAGGEDPLVYSPCAAEVVMVVSL